MVSYQCSVPVLLLIFNRPRHAEAAFKRIREVKPPRLYIHADGPRSDRPGEAEAVATTRKVVEKIDWPCEVFTLFRTENKGLREGVKGALDWFFEAEPAGIVIEDDCLPDPSFFQFCAEVLEVYADNPNVMHIGGSNLIEHQTQSLHESYIITKFSLVWGWASWRRAWQKMDINLTGLDEFIQSGKIAELTSVQPAQTYMLDKFQVTRDRKNNSWAYAWFYSILKNNGTCLLPTVNLVQNTGVGDEQATNTNQKDAKSAIAARQMKFPLTPPCLMKRDQAIENQLFYYTQKSRLRLWIWYFLHLFGLR